MADIFLFDVCGTSTCSLCAKYHAIFSDPWFLRIWTIFPGMTGLGEQSGFKYIEFKLMVCVYG